MHIRVGNMTEHLEEADVVLFTANSLIKKDGTLVMGAGFAKTIRDLFPGIALELGTALKKRKDKDAYGILMSSGKIGAFQTKGHPSIPSSMYYIHPSITALKELALNNPEKTYYLNYPGIGMGGLSIGQVYPVIEMLPDNVTIWVLKGRL
jgi:hypothetical protein